MKKKVISLFFVTLLSATMLLEPLLACTILAVGKSATADGSTIITHNDDSTSADFRLWIIPGGEWEEGSTRDLVIDSHNYGDYGKYPEVKDYGNGYPVIEIEQAEKTYSYFHSRYSFMNEKGVAMGESTFTIDKSTEYGAKVRELIYGNNLGLIDCWNAQDIALERASSAREAVRIMGDLVEAYGWKDDGETINVCDGDEVWVAEFYGLDLWAAVRIPDDAYFVAANRARIDHIDFDDDENYMYSPNIKSFAIENGLWSEESGVPFSPAEIYAPNDAPYSTLREWRAFDLVAPSLHLDPTATRYPLWVIPEKKLSVQDIFEIKGDYYQGTEYDLSKNAYAGPYGDPLAPQNPTRAINIFRTCYVMIANVKSWLPDEAKCLVWYGYGAPDSTYITPLWPSMTELPKFYSTGNRYDGMSFNSGWWVNSYVQQIARINYQSAIKDIHEFRQPRMDMIYDLTEAIQEEAARLIENGKEETAKNLITNFAYDTATNWFDSWIGLGDELVGKYMWGHKNFSTQAYSPYYKAVLDSAPANN